MDQTMRPFCANERCFMNALEVPTQTDARRVQWPDGSIRLYTRDWLHVPAHEGWYPVCHSCAHVVAMIRSAGENVRPAFGLPITAAPGTPVLPFCANVYCFTHVLEVPAFHEETVVGLPGGSSRTFTRDWLYCRTRGRKYPLCDCCGNIPAVIRGDGEGLEPHAGTSVIGQLYGPDGEVLHTAEPEPEPADIDEPKILH